MKKSLNGEEIVIRKVELTDWEQFFEIKKKGIETDPDAFLATTEEINTKTEKDIKEWIARDYVLGAFLGGKLVGTIHLIKQIPQKFQHIGIIGGMYVDLDYRGFKIGRILISAMLEYIRRNEDLYSLQLKVVTSNAAAIKLYESFGFKKWASEENALLYKGKFTDQYHYMLKL